MKFFSGLNYGIILIIKLFNGMPMFVSYVMVIFLNIFYFSGLSVSSSFNKDQQSIEMKQKRTANKSIGTLMSFGATHDKYTKGIDITQVGTFCSALYSSKGFIVYVNISAMHNFYVYKLFFSVILELRET